MSKSGDLPSNPNEPTEEPGQTMTQKTKPEQLHDSVDDWHTDSEFIEFYYSEKLNMLWCPIHRMCANRGSMSKHYKATKHDAVTETSLIGSKNLGKQLTDAERPSIAVYMTPEQMILEDHNREIAEAAGMLAKDYELRAEYEMLHQQDRIPYDWSFYDWLKLGCVVNWNEKWKINLSLNQDVGLLEANQRDWLKLTLTENTEKRKAETEQIVE